MSALHDASASSLVLTPAVSRLATLPFLPPLCLMLSLFASQVRCLFAMLLYRSQLNLQLNIVRDIISRSSLHYPYFLIPKDCNLALISTRVAPFEAKFAMRVKTCMRSNPMDGFCWLVERWEAFVCVLSPRNMCFQSLSVTPLPTNVNRTKIS